jgi:DNA-binding transcriptional LysR family regulator
MVAPVTETQLRVLVAVADAGGFSSAASRLKMSQPAISRAVAHLEEELGVRLFVRTPSGVSLTNVGLRVVTHAREVLARTESMRQVAGTVTGGYAGRLRIGILPSLSASLISPILGRFCAAHPAVEIELHEDRDDIVVDSIRSQTIDIGLVARSAGDLDIAVLHRASLVAVLPSTHALAERDAIRPSDLQDEPLIVPRSGFERLVDQTFRSLGRMPRVAFEVCATETALAMVAERLGVAVVPDLLAADLPAGATALPLEPSVTIELGLAVRSAAQATPLTIAFLEAAGADVMDLTHVRE